MNLSGPWCIRRVPFLSNRMPMECHSVLSQQWCNQSFHIAHRTACTLSCSSQRPVASTSGLHIVERLLYGGREWFIGSDIEDPLALVLVSVPKLVAHAA